jgi:predicted nucleic acid-binding protein
VNLTDTGPLVAIADKNDPAHARCVAATKTLPKFPLLTTWPCFTEAMHLHHRERGYPAQESLWQLRRKGIVIVHELTEEEGDRMDALMKQYRDIEMDLADASLVAVSESLNLNRIFTLDNHFRAYRINNTGVFEVVP